MASPVDVAKKLGVDGKDLSRIESVGRATRALQYLMMAVSAVAGLLVGRAAFAEVTGVPPSTYPYLGLTAVGFVRPSRAWIATFALSAILFVLFCALGAVSGGMGSEPPVTRYSVFSRRSG